MRIPETLPLDIVYLLKPDAYNQDFKSTPEDIQPPFQAKVSSGLVHYNPADNNYSKGAYSEKSRKQEEDTVAQTEPCVVRERYAEKQDNDGEECGKSNRTYQLEFFP